MLQSQKFKMTAITHKETYTPIAEYPSQDLQHKVQIMTGTELLNEDGSPPHPEACNRSWDGR